jgi:hypothetical protein
VGKYSDGGKIMYPRFHRVCKVSALLAATLILPVLTFAGNNQGGNNNNQGGNNNNQGKVPVAPEANAGWVLIPFFGTVLLFSARQFFRAKA